MTTGEKIAALRREHKLSQEALGEKLGLSRQAVSKWEADQAVPTMDNLMELSRLFGVPVDTLLRPDAPFPAAPAEDGAGKESEDAPAAPETPSAPRQPRRNKAVLIGGAALLCVSLALNAVCLYQIAQLKGEVQALRDAGGEYGAATGRPRRVGPFDVPASRYGVRMQGADTVVLTKLDVLSYLDRVPVCVAYEVDGVRTTDFPTGDRLLRAKPVVEYADGFGDVSACRTWDSLPENARKYIRFIEQAVGCRVGYVSVGAGRDEYIKL